MSKFRKISNFILPNLGVVGGAANGLIQGQGLKGALRGGLEGGVRAAGSMLGGPLGGALGIGATAGGALAGAGAGALGAKISGGNPLSGALSGGIGGYLGNGGLSQITDGLGLGGTTDSGLQVGKLYDGTAADNAFLQSAQKASGIGSIGTQGGGLGGLSSLAGGNGNMFLSGLSALNQYGTAGKIEDDMLKAQQQAAAGFAPYQQTGELANQQLSSALQSGKLGGDFNFEADPGYQFRKQQGEEALMRAQAARGGVFSGQALREASEFNQGLANQAYQDAYGRDITRQQSLYGMLSGTAGRGQQAAGSLGGIYDNMGDIRGNSRLAQSNALTGFAADALGGDIIGYRMDGTPITRRSSLAGFFNG
jgi:hypothetical protein